MRILIFIFVYLLVNNCSFNKDSKYWTEDNIKKALIDKKLMKIINKSGDIRLMSIDEYKIYIDDYLEKSKYPNITNE